MATVINYADYKRGLRLGRAKFVDPVLADIIDVLLTSGGVAHRQVVADRIASRRLGRPAIADRKVQDEVFGVFDDYLAVAATRRPAPLLCLPFGAGSYRWALTPAGERLFAPRASTADRRQAH
ncbi:hypothetical protein BH09PSE1_BH09PSE1_09520 [soil metagenome]